ncbi:hypothetical protein IU427_26485 [Nocardia beijingensis]|uniref:hypothetical protein n=1 Tax=Nocardia beijingensis TaxID=95162 RepID=UPI001895626B|nr:hypothetical protein [Nocardia beijingensis]MBF6468684.1 hypothetical protein [Nocardia beijingensis]
MRLSTLLFVCLFKHDPAVRRQQLRISKLAAEAIGIRAEATRRLRGSIAPADWHNSHHPGHRCRIERAAVDPARHTRGRRHHPTVQALTRRDDTSVSTTSGSQLYTSPQILAAEERLIAASLVEGGRTIPAAAVDAAIIEHTASSNGQMLNDGQVQLLRQFAISRVGEVAREPPEQPVVRRAQLTGRSWCAYYMPMPNWCGGGYIRSCSLWCISPGLRSIRNAFR